MKHGMTGRKFGRHSGDRKALFNNLAASLIRHEQIVTTLPKAKDLRPIVEKLITKAKSGTIHDRRIVSASIKEKEVLDKLFSGVAERYKTRNGGYIRIMKAGNRKGDNAPMAVIELVDRDVEARGAAQRAQNAAAADILAAA